MGILGLSFVTLLCIQSAMSQESPYVPVKHVARFAGETLVIELKLKGKAPPDIVFKKGNMDVDKNTYTTYLKKMDTVFVLKIGNLTDSAAGMYTLSFKYADQLDYKFNLTIEEAPSISKDMQLEFGVHPGSDIKFQVNVTGKVRPHHFNLTRDGQVVPSEMYKVTYRQGATGSGRLFIKLTDVQDDGMYLLTVYFQSLIDGDSVIKKQIPFGVSFDRDTQMAESDNGINVMYIIYGIIPAVIAVILIVAFVKYKSKGDNPNPDGGAQDYPPNDYDNGYPDASEEIRNDEESSRPFSGAEDQEERGSATSVESGDEES